jgi:hypothetical protein
MKDEPFAIVGVNTDPKESYDEWQKKLPVTWRSFADGDPGGPICKRWDVGAFPTIYVLDHLGVIRHKDLRGEELTDAVKALVEAAARKPESR